MSTLRRTSAFARHKDPAIEIFNATFDPVRGVDQRAPALVVMTITPFAALGSS
jgi:hypothetical protein